MLFGVLAAVPKFPIPGEVNLLTSECNRRSEYLKYPQIYLRELRERLRCVWLRLPMCNGRAY